MSSTPCRPSHGMKRRSVQHGDRSNLEGEGKARATHLFENDLRTHLLGYVESISEAAHRRPKTQAAPREGNGPRAGASGRPFALDPLVSLEFCALSPDTLIDTMK